MLDLGGRWGEHLVGDRDLYGVQADLAAIAEVATHLGVGAEAVLVTHGQHGLVQRGDFGQARGQTHLTACVKYLHACCGPTAADIGDEVLGTEIRPIRTFLQQLSSVSDSVCCLQPDNDGSARRQRRAQRGQLRLAFVLG